MFTANEWLDPSEKAHAPNTKLYPGGMQKEVTGLKTIPKKISAVKGLNTEAMHP